MSKRWNAYKQYIGLTVLVVLIGVLFGMQKVSAANAAVMVVLTAAVFFLNKIENGKLQWLRHLVLLFANILFAFTILNSLTGFVNVLDLCKEIFLDILLVGFFYLIIAGISGSVRFTVWTGNILATVFMVVNIFLQDVRGRKLNYFDISSLGTALNVAGQYRLKLTLSMVLAVVTLILFTWWSMQGLQKLKQDYRFYIGRGCFAAAGIFVFFLCIGTGFLKKFGVYDRAWDYDQESILLNFIVEYRETCTTEDAASAIPQPEGYSEEKAVAVLQKYSTNEVEEAEETTPNIIVIMNESYADLRVYGSLGEADETVMPFYDSLRENMVKGTAYSSVFGGNTASAEYEFLTGDSIILYPGGSVAYSNYLKDYEKIYSIVDIYRNMGYETYGMHPYRENGWYRDRIYPAMGFENILFETDYPHQDTIRSFVSDKEDYEKIIETFENKNSERMFVFNVTMQNHGDYSDRTWKGEIQVDDLAKEDDSFDKEELELYLSLMKESDKALEQLITYFEAVDEPVAILLFGDHQPGIEYAMEKGEEAAPMDKYAVPFFLWTNYETKEEQVEAVSMNYLPVLLAEKTQTPMNAYFRYLQDLYTKYPVVTGEGAIDRNGEYKERTDRQLQQDLLEYEYVMYYRLTGSGEEYESYFGY